LTAGLGFFTTLATVTAGHSGAGLHFRRAEVLREVVDADHLGRQLARRREHLRFAFGDRAGGDGTGEQPVGPLARQQLRIHATFLQRRAQLGLDRLGSDGRRERTLDLGKRIVFGLRQVNPGRQAVACRRRLDQQARDLVAEAVDGITYGRPSGNTTLRITAATPGSGSSRSRLRKRSAP
jgi:hypothetical protein